MTMVIVVASELFSRCLLCQVLQEALILRSHASCLTGIFLLISFLSNDFLNEELIVKLIY